MLKGSHLSEESKAKISAAKKGKPSYTRTFETLLKQSLRQKGKPCPQRGHSPSRSQINAIKEAQIGRHPSDEVRSRLSALAANRLQYGGRRPDGFRSGWEAKVADYLTAHGFDWEYEERSYPVGSRHYVPDFTLYHQDGAFVKLVEVKGRWMRDAKAKVEQFHTQYPDVSLEIWDRPKLKQLGIL